LASFETDDIFLRTKKIKTIVLVGGLVMSDYVRVCLVNKQMPLYKDLRLSDLAFGFTKRAGKQPVMSKKKKGG
jgi:hypothetical protein